MEAKSLGWEVGSRRWDVNDRWEAGNERWAVRSGKCGVGCGRWNNVRDEGMHISEGRVGENKTKT